MWQKWGAHCGDTFQEYIISCSVLCTRPQLRFACLISLQKNVLSFSFLPSLNAMSQIGNTLLDASFWCRHTSSLIWNRSQKASTNTHLTMDHLVLCQVDLFILTHKFAYSEQCEQCKYEKHLTFSFHMVMNIHGQYMGCYGRGHLFNDME